MNTSFKIDLIPYEEMDSMLPLAYELNKGSITMEVLKSRLQEMLQMGGYQCIGAYDNDELIGIIGIWTLMKLYAGKHIEPDNVFIKEAYRSKGVGKLMLDWMFDYAEKEGCIASEVNCYKSNERGNKFWRDQGYEPSANHLFKYFKK